MGTKRRLSLLDSNPERLALTLPGTIDPSATVVVHGQSGGDDMWRKRVEEYAEHKVLFGQWRASSRRTCVQLLDVFVSQVGGSVFDADALAAFVNEPGKADATRVMRWTVTAGFLRWVGVDVVIPSPPRPRRMPRPLADVDVAALLAVCTPRCEVLVSLAVCEGLRCAELHRLDLDDVDIGGRLVFVQGKGGHQRWVPLTEASAARIVRYCDGDRGWGGGPLIQNARTGDRLSISMIGNRCRQLMIDAGIKRPGVNLHALRHTAATRLWMESSDLFMVQQMLGHSSIATTAAYVAGRPTDAMRESMNRCST